MSESVRSSVSHRAFWGPSHFEPAVRFAVRDFFLFLLLLLSFFPPSPFFSRQPFFPPSTFFFFSLSFSSPTHLVASFRGRLSETATAVRPHLWGCPESARSRAVKATPVTAASTSAAPARACSSNSSSNNNNNHHNHNHYSHNNNSRNHNIRIVPPPPWGPCCRLVRGTVADLFIRRQGIPPILH